MLPQDLRIGRRGPIVVEALLRLGDGHCLLRALWRGLPELEQINIVVFVDFRSHRVGLRFRYEVTHLFDDCTLGGLLRGLLLRIADDDTLQSKVVFRVELIELARRDTEILLCLCDGGLVVT